MDEITAGRDVTNTNIDTGSHGLIGSSVLIEPLEAMAGRVDQLLTTLSMTSSVRPWNKVLENIDSRLPQRLRCTQVVQLAVKAEISTIFL